MILASMYQRLPSSGAKGRITLHVGRVLAVLFAVTSVFATLPPPTAQAQAVPRDDPRFGAVQAINSPERAVQAGVRWERIIFPWAEMQPNSPDQMLAGYHTEAQIEAQARRGISMAGVVLYTPGWAATDPTKGGSAIPRGLDRPASDRNNYWAQFMGKLAAKYKGKVDTWIVWNEPDMVDLETKQGITWAGSEADFWMLQKSAYQAIKQANPEAKVLIAGFSYWHAKEVGLPPYLKRLLDIAAADSSSARNNWYFDGISLHPYANPLNSFALPTISRRILAERGLKKTIWNIESNAVPWDDPIGLLPREPWRVTMEEQASYVVQAFALGLAADVDRMSVYKMRDEFPENGQYFGLIREDGSARPGYTGLQTAVTYFTGTKNARYTWNGSANPPSEAEITAVISSNQNRFQFIWPGQISQVAMERERQRVTVVWNTSRKPLVALVGSAANEATLVDSLGRTSSIAPVNGSYQIYLDAARSNTDPRDATLTMVGGRPLIIIEQVGGNARPSQPPGASEGLSFENGFSVANGKFAEYFQRLGGKNTFGLPISREFELLGLRTQIFQRHVLQLDESGNVQSLNLADSLLPYARVNNSQFPPIDPGLRGAAPTPADPAYAEKVLAFVRDRVPDTWEGRPINFGQTFFSGVKCTDVFGQGACQQGIVDLLNFEVWGLPISAPAADPTNGSFVYQRFQRGILHYDSNCGCTQALLLGEHLKSIVTGQNLPADLDEQAQSSAFYKQYDQSRVQGMNRPGALPRSNFKDAFDPIP